MATTAIETEPEPIMNVPGAIVVSDLKKYFGAIKAVDGIDLEIQAGELFSLLGPNGAGKSTTIRMLTTVLTPDAGDASIAGLSLRKQRVKIRELLGVCPQEIAIAETLSAEENVTFVAQMHGIPKEEAKQAATTILTQLGIAGQKNHAKNFSGGMKRRLNLAMALVHNPKIIFLDEPSAGLDPQARLLLWDFIRDLKRRGATIILTTHDMAEAEALSDHVAIIDSGKIIARGTPRELKEQYGSGNILEVQFASQADLEQAKTQIESVPYVTKVTSFGENYLLVSFTGGLKNFIKILQAGVLEHINDVENLSFRQNTLEDVFLHLTGRRLRE